MEASKSNLWFSQPTACLFQKIAIWWWPWLEHCYRNWYNETHRIDPDRACLAVSKFPSLWSPGITVPRSWVFCLRQRSLAFPWWSGEWLPKYIGKSKGVKGIFPRSQWHLAEVWRIWLRCLSIGKSNSFREIILPFHRRLLLNLRFWICAWLWRISGG